MSRNICGTFTVDAKAEKPSAQYKEKNGGNVITLNCSPAVEVSTDAANPTSFYITLPVGAIAENSGFVAEIYNERNHLVTSLKSTNKSGKATIARAQITKMANKVCPWIPKSYTEYDYLKSTLSTTDPVGNLYKGQIINTGINPATTGGLHIKTKAKMNVESTININPAICGLAQANNFDNWVALDYSNGGVRVTFDQYVVTLPTEWGIYNVFDCDFTFTKDKFETYFNGIGTSETLSGDMAIPDAANFCLFGDGLVQEFVGTSNLNHSDSRIYSFVMYNPADENMLRNFIPVANGGVSGMWDTVTDSFYGAEKTGILLTGSLTAGND